MPLKGTRKLRVGRHSEDNRIYFVTTVVDRRRPIFNSFEYGRILVNVLRYEDSLDELNSLAFVIMPDHLHWLIELRTGGELSKSIGRVKAISGRKLNGRLESAGRFWQPGFHDHALRREEDMRDFARYLVANPLRAGLVRSLGDYSLWDAIWL